MSLIKKIQGLWVVEEFDSVSTQPFKYYREDFLQALELGLSIRDRKHTIKIIIHKITDNELYAMKKTNQVGYFNLVVKHGLFYSKHGGFTQNGNYISFKTYSYSPSLEFILDRVDELVEHLTIADIDTANYLDKANIVYSKNRTLTIAFKCSAPYNLMGNSLPFVSDWA